MCVSWVAGGGAGGQCHLLDPESKADKGELIFSTRGRPLESRPQVNRSFNHVDLSALLREVRSSLSASTYQGFCGVSFFFSTYHAAMNILINISQFTFLLGKTGIMCTRFRRVDATGQATAWSRGKRSFTDSALWFPKRPCPLTRWPCLLNALTGGSVTFVLSFLP